MELKDLMFYTFGSTSNKKKYLNGKLLEFILIIVMEFEYLDSEAKTTMHQPLLLQAAKPAETTSHQKSLDSRL